MDLFREYFRDCVTASASHILRLALCYQIFASKIISRKKMKVRKIFKFSFMMELVTVLWMKRIAKLNC